jgi:hypothetical protein
VRGAFSVARPLRAAPLDRGLGYAGEGSYSSSQEVLSGPVQM